MQFVKKAFLDTSILTLLSLLLIKTAQKIETHFYKWKVLFLLVLAKNCAKGFVYLICRKDFYHHTIIIMGKYY